MHIVPKAHLCVDDRITYFLPSLEDYLEVWIFSGIFQREPVLVMKEGEIVYFSIDHFLVLD